MEFFEQQDLFVSGQGGYVRYRIPALAVSARGTVLAFCEARKFTGSDSDQIDLFLRRSFDNGRTFGEVQVVATEEGWVCGNPAPVVDRFTGTVWLAFCRENKDVFITHSVDDGATWTKPKNITRAVKDREWPSGWWPRLWSRCCYDGWDETAGETSACVRASVEADRPTWSACWCTR